QAVAPEEFVFLHVDDDVEVAGGRAARAPFAFALKPQLLAGGDAGRNLHGNLPLLRHLARAPARLARLGDRASGSTALRARAGHGEEPLLESHLSLAPALVADNRRGARRSARAGA